MKSLKLISASLLACAAASLASAVTTLNVAGSTAFRSATCLAEIAIASYGPTSTIATPVAGTPNGAFDGSTANNFKGATYSVIHGYLVDGSEIYIRNHWTGSAAGLADLTSGNTTLKQIQTSVPMSALTSAGSGGTSQGTLSVFDLAPPEVAMSDVAAAEVAASVATGGSVGATYAAGIGSAALAEGGTSPSPVAVVTFQWVLGALDSALTTPPFTNITQNQAGALIAGGSLPLSVFTNNPADSGNFVFFTGRNEDSGTRICSFAESQNPNGQFGGSSNQWMLQIDSTYPANNSYSSLSKGTAVTGMKLWPKNWPVNTISTLNWNTTGHSGYNGGGDVAAILSTPNTNIGSLSPSNAPAGFVVGTSKSYFVSCLGTNDAKNIYTGNAINGTPLTYNGVSMGSTNNTTTTDFANFENGSYSIWSYEHLYYLTAATGTQVAVSGVAATAAKSLADHILTVATSPAALGNSGIPVNLMNVTRSATGGSVN